MIGKTTLRADEMWVRFQKYIEDKGDLKFDEEWLPLWWAFQAGAGRTKLNNGPAATRPQDHSLWPDFVTFMTKNNCPPILEMNRDSWIFHWRLFIEGADAAGAERRERMTREE